MAAIQMFRNLETHTERAKRIRWALDELHAGRWLA